MRGGCVFWTKTRGRQRVRTVEPNGVLSQLRRRVCCQRMPRKAKVSHSLSSSEKIIVLLRGFIFSLKTELQFMLEILQKCQREWMRKLLGSLCRMLWVRARSMPFCCTAWILCEYNLISGYCSRRNALYTICVYEWILPLPMTSLINRALFDCLIDGTGITFSFASLTIYLTVLTITVYRANILYWSTLVFFLIWCDHYGEMFNLVGVAVEVNGR